MTDWTHRFLNVVLFLAPVRLRLRRSEQHLLWLVAVLPFGTRQRAPARCFALTIFLDHHVTRVRSPAETGNTTHGAESVHTAVFWWDLA